MKFTDFLKQKLYETHAKESLIDYYFLPTNTFKTINNPTKRLNYAREILECAKAIVKKYKRLRLSFRKENKEFIEKSFGKLNKSELRDLVTKILLSLKPEDFDEELIEDHSAYVFILQIADLEKRISIQIKDKSLRYKYLYIKFDIVNLLDRNSDYVIYGIQNPWKINKNSVIIDPKNAFVDFISIHISIFNSKKIHHN